MITYAFFFITYCDYVYEIIVVMQYTFSKEEETLVFSTSDSLSVEQLARRHTSI